MVKNRKTISNERYMLNYEEVKRIFPWIDTIETTRSTIKETKCTLRLTFDHTSFRIGSFDKERELFDQYVWDFYKKKNSKASTTWSKDHAIVAVF